MTIQIVSPLNQSFQRDVKALAAIWTDAASPGVPDGAIVAITEVANEVVVGLATLGASTEVWEESAVGGANASNLKIVFNGSARLDAQELQQLTVLDGSGFLVETTVWDVADVANFLPGTALTVGATGATAGQLEVVTTPATDPVVAIVDHVKDATTLVVKIV
jgi:hypothetical protein